MRRPVLLVGEAPGKVGRPGDAALGGRIGRRLAGLMDVPFETYLAEFERVNLLPRWRGAGWPVRRAREAALEWRFTGVLDDRVVILLGRRVAAAFGIRGAPLWFQTILLQEHIMIVGTVFPTPVRAVVRIAPHPSGSSRWWNDPRNVEQAKHFWRSLFATSRWWGDPHNQERAKSFWRAAVAADVRPGRP